jgi:LysM repeat protein
VDQKKIGIKIADGRFYPVIGGTGPEKRQLTLTTVHPSQTSVQIDIYRGNGVYARENEYIGSLVIESIPALPAGEAEIELEVSLGDGEKVVARAFERSTGEHQSLSVSLEALTASETYEIPEFDLTGTIRDSYDSDGIAPAEFESLMNAGAEKEQPESGKRLPAWGFVLIGIAIILGALIVLLATGVIRLPVAAAEKPASLPATEAISPSEPAAAPNQAKTAPAAETQPAATAASAPAASAPAAPVETAKNAGVWYKIKWGDTLWDLSMEFYQTPWLYGKIARANNIKNPDHIISGERIFLSQP